MKILYGRYAIFTPVDGKAEELVKVLLLNSAQMKKNGALIYNVGMDINNKNSVIIYSVWSTRSDKVASMNDPSVAETVTKAMPLIQGRPHSVDTIVYEN